MNRTNISEMYLTDKYPAWVTDITDRSMFNTDFYEIFSFFVFFSPCEKHSAQKRDLQYYGWKEKPWQTNRYLKDKLNRKLQEKGLYVFKPVEKLELFKHEFDKANIDENFQLDLRTQKAVFINNNNSVYMSLFSHIRCAFAHGRIAMVKVEGKDEIAYIMENGLEKGRHFQVKARMVLYKSTLLDWIAIIQGGPQETEREYGLEILEIIKENNKITIKKIAKALGETEYVVKKSIERLKKHNLIVHQNHGKNSFWQIIDLHSALRLLEAKNE